MKKGYEEVHVPAVRSVISKDEKLVPIQDLPAWTHDAFKGMEKLNRGTEVFGKYLTLYPHVSGRDQCGDAHDARYPWAVSKRMLCG
jgi:hypothetical protein